VEEDKKAKKLQSMIQECETDKNRYKRIWDMCALFLNNQQHLRYDDVRRRFVARRTRNSFTANKIVNPFRNLQAKLIAAYPSVAIAPASDSVEDILKAEASEAALSYYWYTSKMKNLVGKLVRWVLMTGNVGILTRYSKKQDQVITEVIAPYDLYFEPGATEIEESSFVAIRQIVKREDLKEAYPDHKEQIDSQGEASPPYGLRSYFGSMQSEQKPIKNTVDIHHVYYKDGRHCVIMGPHLLFETKWPGDTFPVQFIRHTITEGILWGMGAIEPVIDVQIHYNRSRQQVIENTLLTANPPWMIPNSSGVQAGMITGKPGNEIFYDDSGGRAPTPVQMPGMPAYVPQNISQLESEIGDIMGIHSTTLGKRAIGIHSGAAIENLSAMDMTQLQVTQDSIEDAFIDLCKVVLALMKAHYKEARLIRMMDETGAMVYRQLSQTDIAENPEVRVEVGSLFRDEIQDREKRVLDLMQAGLISREDAAREINFRTGSSYITKRMRGMSHAQELLIAATQGSTIEIFATDDIEAFKQVFGDFIQSQTYYSLAPEIQEYIRDVFVSLETFGMPDEQARSQMLERTVFPRQERAPEDASKLMASYGAPAAAAQAGQEHDAYSARRAFRQQMDGEASPERGITMTNMGGGG
jgi:hypothetical protein